MSRATIVIGGGICGLATAYALSLEGNDVTVIDAGPIDQRASTATAGIIGGSSVIPWASLGLWPRIPAHMLNRDAPLFFARPLPPKLGAFTFKSIAASRSKPRLDSAKALANLGLRGWDAWQNLLDGLPDTRALFSQKGCLLYYATPEQMQAEASGNALRKSFGMQLADISEAEMKQALPPLSCSVVGGTLIKEAGHVTNPVALQEHLRAAIMARGGTFVAQSVTGMSVSGNRITAVSTMDGLSYSADAVVLCAGAGSAKLAEQLGHTVPMIPAWGASVTFTNPSVDLTAPLLMLSDGIAVTPSDAGLRVSGLLQVGGAGKAEAMIRTLTRKAKDVFGAFTYSDTIVHAGPRPLMADSLPCLGRDPRVDNAYHNFGHGHWGLTQASISAQVVSDLVMDRATRIDIAAYGVDRF
jgi:D-amino-acid dehydrogenase